MKTGGRCPLCGWARGHDRECYSKGGALGQCSAQKGGVQCARPDAHEDACVFRSEKEAP